MGVLIIETRRDKRLDDNPPLDVVLAPFLESVAMLNEGPLVADRQPPASGMPARIQLRPPGPLAIEGA